LLRPTRVCLAGQRKRCSCEKYSTAPFDRMLHGDSFSYVGAFIMISVESSLIHMQEGSATLIPKFTDHNVSIYYDYDHISSISIINEIGCLIGIADNLFDRSSLRLQPTPTMRCVRRLKFWDRSCSDII
jgi:hypothetical protein